MKIISEIGINHTGVFKLNEELIRQSALGGADYAKFQLYTSMRVFGDESRKKNEFTLAQVKDLKAICDFYRIKFLASVFDEEKLGWCEEIGVDCYKIASRTVAKEKDLTERIIRIGKPVYASLGFWEEKGLPDLPAHVKYLNCISKYPTSCMDIKPLRPYDARVVGYSDHSYGVGMVLYHIAQGASVIEKHFTLDKSLEGNDHVGAMDLQELKIIRECGGQIYNVRQKLAQA